MIIAVDPGPHTGVARWYPDLEQYHFETLDFTQLVSPPHLHLYNYMKDFCWPMQDCTIVCEKFEYQKEKAKFREHLNYDAAEYVGVVKLYAQQHNCKLIMQSPSTAVGDSCFWTNDKLARLGLYRGGRRHENDALRHLLYYRTFTLGDQSLLHRLK